MKREILFKAKSQKKEEWVEGLLGRYVDECEWLIIIDETGADFEVFENTVCQYIGREDKNGRKIFEGDVCRAKTPNSSLDSDTYDRLYVVAWNDKYNQWGYKMKSNRKGDHFVDDRWAEGRSGLMIVGNNHGGAYCEVVGNIHD